MVGSVMSTYGYRNRKTGATKELPVPIDAVGTSPTVHLKLNGHHSTVLVVGDYTVLYTVVYVNAAMASVISARSTPPVHYITVVGSAAACVRVV